MQEKNDDGGKCCGQKQLMLRRKSSNLQAINRMCFCSGKTRIGDIMASAKEGDKCGKQQLDLQNELLKKMLKATTPSSSGGSSDDGLIRCGRCGGKKKQKDSCTRNSSSSWIMETMNLMNRLIEERRRTRSKCVNEKPKINEVPVNVIKKDEGSQAVQIPKIKVDDESDALKTKQQSIKYSLIETSTHSTQTLESIITISDASKPHLLKILADIQQYAKSIEDYFYRINESMKRSHNSNAQHSVTFKEVDQDGNVRRIQKVQNIVPSQNVQSILHRQDVPIVKTTESAQNLQNSQTIQNFPSLKEDQRTQETRRDTFQDISQPPKEEDPQPYNNALDLTRALAAYQGREDEEIPSPPELPPSLASSLPSLPYISMPTERRSSDNTSVSDDFDVSDLDQAPPFASTPRESLTLADSKAESTDPLNQPVEDGDVDSVEHLAISKAQKNMLKRPLQESDPDSTDYTPLPKQLDRRPAMVYDESLVEQVEEVATDMESIQQKIERLRRELFLDFEDSSHSRDSSREKKSR